MSYDIEKWHHDYHLIINDDGSNSVSGLSEKCGPSCSRYTGTVTNKSGKENKIYPGVHTWDARSYARTEACDQAGGKKHNLLEDGQPKGSNFREGEKWMRPITLGAGQSQTYTIELDLNKTGMTKDWSFTAWGENGPVEVNVAGKSKHHWPYVNRDDSKLPV